MTSKLPSNVLSFKKFLLRQEVLALYRSFLRAVKGIQDDRSKNQLQDWIRTEFKNHTYHSDEEVIKSLLKHGRRSLQELQQTLNRSK